MMARFLLCLLACLLPVMAALGASADFEYGPRPPHSVFDPGGFLDPQVTQEISDPLAKILAEQGVDVIVVIMDDLEGAPPEHVAGGWG